MKAKLLLGALLMLGSMSSYATTVVCHVGTDSKPYCKKGLESDLLPHHTDVYTKISSNNASKITVGNGKIYVTNISGSNPVIDTYDFDFRKIVTLLPTGMEGAPTKIVDGYVNVLTPGGDFWNPFAREMFQYSCLSTTSQDIYCSEFMGGLYRQPKGGRTFKDFVTMRKHIWAVDTNNTVWFKRNYRAVNEDWVQFTNDGLNHGPITNLSLDNRTLSVCGVTTGKQIYCNSALGDTPWFRVDGGGSDEVSVQKGAYWATASGSGDLWVKQSYNGTWYRENGRAAPYNENSLGKLSVGDDILYNQGNLGYSPTP